MSKRREGREAAVQYLYKVDVHGDVETDMRADFWTLRDAPAKVRKFAEELIAGVNAHREELDARIMRYVQNFTLNRLNVVDRNILRLAIYEMFYNLEVPPVVAINEAIDIAKKFGGPDSGKFVNGLLDKVKSELTRPLREAPPFKKEGTADASPAAI